MYVMQSLLPISLICSYSVKFKKNGGTKQEYLEQAAQIEGIYVPSLYDISYNEDGTVKAITPKNNAPAKVRKQIIDDFDKVYTPDSFVVPYTQIVHDRSVVEVLRGCIRGCRFCQAGMIYRPNREKAQAMTRYRFHRCPQATTAILRDF